MAIKTSKSLAKIFSNFSENKLSNPYFIIGCARSGTSILYKTLASHREIATYPTEANDLWHPKAYPWHSSDLGSPPIWIDPFSYTEASMANRSSRDDNEIKSVFGMFQYLSRGKCFLNKSAMISFMIPKIIELFPDAKFIHIIRDGRAVAFSYATRENTKKIDKFPSSYQRDKFDLPFDELLMKLAIHWEQNIQEIQRQNEKLGLVDKGLLFEFHYEDLCLQPMEKLTSITSFMNVNPNGFQIEDFSHIKNMNHKYQEKLSREIIDKIEQTIESTLKSTNYL